MIVPLIPLYLVAIIGVTENDWKYGPEVIYDVRVDSVAKPFEQTEKITTLNMTMKLNCRPKLASSLICKFNDPSVEISATKNTDKILTEEQSCGDESFELKFSLAGLEEIVVPPSIDPPRLDMIRALVAQLNVGTNLSNVFMVESELPENFTTGMCKTNYNIMSGEFSESDKKARKEYEIVKAHNQKSLREISQIRRTRNLDECDYRVDYFFGSREGQRATPSNIATKIRSSRSYLMAKPTEFISWTENTIIVSNKLNTKGGTTLTERITLTLENIVPADKPLATISDPSGASIFPGTWLYDDTSEEENSSEETNDFS